MSALHMERVDQSAIVYGVDETSGGGYGYAERITSSVFSTMQNWLSQDHDPGAGGTTTTQGNTDYSHVTIDTPPATGTPPVFVVFQGGYLYQRTSSGTWKDLATNVAAVSNTSFDAAGNAMVDVLFNGGAAYEYREPGQWHALSTNVYLAKPGNGVSYVLFNGGYLYKFDDATSAWSEIAEGVASFSVGTDIYGGDMIDIVSSFDSSAWSFSSLQGYWQRLATNVYQVSTRGRTARPPSYSMEDPCIRITPGTAGISLPTTSSPSMRGTI